MAYFVHVLVCICISNAYSSSAGPLDGPVPGCSYSVRVQLQQQLRINILLPVNTLICQGPATVAPALVGWRWGWQLLARRPLACRQPGPEALHQLSSENLILQHVNPPGRCRPGRCGSSSRCRRRRRRVPSNQPRFPSSWQLLQHSFLLVLM